jgi:imidazole glycerol-phosphate synthase subunit HisH
VIAIVDYGMGNLGSISNMLRKVGAEAVVSSDPAEIAAAAKLLLPGVGAFGRGMQNLRERGLIPLLNRKVLEEGTPVLGICLGMQLLTRRSEEGGGEGLGWIEADTVRFRFPSTAGRAPRIPHMGWNVARVARESLLFAGVEGEQRFYFVHSYHVVCNTDNDVVTRTNYGYDFVSSVQHHNIMATQFHPEKSHKYGLRIIQNFIKL